MATSPDDRSIDPADPEAIDAVARATGLPTPGVLAVIRLLADGATVPFIARYRKEATGSLDEVQVAAIRDASEADTALRKRRAAILASLVERDLLTDALRREIFAAPDLATLEDLYRPHRPKRRTRATIARERGLEPLAESLFAQDPALSPEKAARPFIDPAKEVPDLESALAGARDIIAERIADDPAVRAALKERLRRVGVIASRVARGKKKEAEPPEGAKYRDYFECADPVPRAPSHRVLAMLRGEREGILSVSVRIEDDDALEIIGRAHLRNRSPAAREVRTAIEEGYARLLAPSLETELRGELKERADREAIEVFAENLRTLLLEAPLGAKRVLAIDPGFRTGCKWVCLDESGRLLEHGAVFPHSGDRGRREAEKSVRALVSKHAIEAIAIGNGTAGRETEVFIRALGLPAEISVVLVNEAGASIYSASPIAREEFPDLDLTVRGAVSIGRRLMDPLAELVKLDPKTIGVGQYQHDVDAKALARCLDDVVTTCVNRVGVDVNTASASLLGYVSGLGPQLAKNIVEQRDGAKGAGGSKGEAGTRFTSRAQLKKVPRLGPKAFEQCAGFLRIPDAKNPLDRSAVHPESYPVVDRIARSLSAAVGDLIGDRDLRSRVDLAEFVDETVGIPTLEDICDELARPGRDPRAGFEAFSFAEGVTEIEDLHTEMSLPGIVTNVTAFGAFVDVGVHQDGLVHISQLADRFVRDPSEVVQVGQKVRVRVLEVDLARRRIALSMRSGGGRTGPRPDGTS